MEDNLDRNIGRLEGRVDAVERRLEGLEHRLETWLARIESKIERLAEAFSSSQGSVRMGWKILTLAGSVITALLGGVAYLAHLAVQFVNLHH